MWYQRTVKRPASLMVCLVHKYIRHGQHVLEGTMNSERYIKVLQQHMLSSRRRLFQGMPCVFQQDNAKPHTAAVTRAWLCSRRVRVLNWLACNPDISPRGNIWRIVMKNTSKTTTNSSAAGNLYQARMGPPKLQKLITLMPRRLQIVLKKRGDNTMVNMPPSLLL